MDDQKALRTFALPTAHHDCMVRNTSAHDGLLTADTSCSIDRSGREQSLPPLVTVEEHKCVDRALALARCVVDVIQRVRKLDFVGKMY